MNIDSELKQVYKVIATLGIGALLVVSLMYVTIPLNPIFKLEFNTNTQHAVWAGSGFGFAYALGNVIIALFSDRLQRKFILCIGLFALSISTLAVGMSPSLGWLITLRVIQGLLAASFPSVALAYIGDVLSERYRPLAVSILSTAFLLSGILGQLYAQALGNWLGWSSVFWLLALSYLVICTIVYTLPAGSLSNNGRSLAEQVKQTCTLITNPLLLTTYAVSATVLFSFVTMYSGLGSYASARFHLQEEGLMWLRMAGIPGMLLSLCAGTLIQRFTAKRIFIAALILAAFSLGIEALSPSLVLLTITSSVFVAGISIANPSIIVIISKLGGEARGSALALNVFFAFCGASLGSLLSAYIHSFAILCYILIMILFAAVLITWLRVVDSD